MKKCSVFIELGGQLVPLGRDVLDLMTLICQKPMKLSALEGQLVLLALVALRHGTPCSLFASEGIFYLFKGLSLLVDIECSQLR